MADVGNWTVEHCSTIGTGALVLAGAPTGFANFRDSMPASTVWYSIQDGNDREAGIGIFDGVTQIIRSDVRATFIDGVYLDIDPVAINLSGDSIVASTYNESAFIDFEDDPVISGNLTLLGSLIVDDQAQFNSAVAFQDDIIVNGAIFASSGLATAPAYSFAGDPDTGMFRGGENLLQFATDGVSRLTIDGSGVASFGNRVRASDGVLTNPAFSFTGDVNTGMWRSAEDTIQFVTGGAARLTIDANAEFSNRIRTGDGDISLPAYSFTTDTDTGMYRGGPDNIQFATGGINALSLDTSQDVTVPNGNLGVSNGQFSVASIAFTGMQAGAFTALGTPDGGGLFGGSGANTDVTCLNQSGIAVWTVPANTLNVDFAGELTVASNVTISDLGVLTAPAAVRGLSTDFLALSGGTSPTAGAAINLYGQSHATQASDIEFLNSAAVIFNWDASEGVFTFIGNISLTDVTPTLLLSNDIEPTISLDRPAGQSYRLVNEGGLLRWYQGSPGIANATDVAIQLNVDNFAILTGNITASAGDIIADVGRILANGSSSNFPIYSKGTNVTNAMIVSDGTASGTVQIGFRITENDAFKGQFTHDSSANITEVWGPNGSLVAIQMNSVNKVSILNGTLATGGTAQSLGNPAITMQKDGTIRMNAWIDAGSGGRAADEIYFSGVNTNFHFYSSSGIDVMVLDLSNASTGNIRVQDFSSVGATVGIEFSVGQWLSSQVLTSTRVHANFYNPNGQVGTISTNGTSTAYNTASDPMLKTEFEEITNALDSIVEAHDAGAIGLAGFLANPGNRYPMFDGQWVAENQPNTGGNKRTTEQAASMDYGKRTPLHEAAIYELLQRVEQLEQPLH